MRGQHGLTVLGDEEQLATAVRNLLANAINYSPDHTRVTIGVSLADDVVEISVADQGIGIPERDLERIFERFYRVDPARSRATGGTGLGLSIVKHVVRQPRRRGEGVEQLRARARRSPCGLPAHRGDWPSDARTGARDPIRTSPEQRRAP